MVKNKVEGFKIAKVKALLLMIVAVLFVSCSDKDYTTCIPRNVSAVLAVNGMELTGKTSPVYSLVTPFLSEDKKEMKGLDMTKNVYFFETRDGNFGLCASVIDDYDLDDFVKRMSNLGAVENLDEEDGITSGIIKGSWVMCYNSSALLVMGPVMNTKASQEKMCQRMRYLMTEQSEEESAVATPLWQKLEEIKKPVRMVAIGSALPEQFASMFTLCAPKGTNTDDIIIEASMEYKDGRLMMYGMTDSFNEMIRQSLKSSRNVFREMTFDWNSKVSDTMLAGIYMNVKGEDFMTLLQNNKSLTSILMASDAYDILKNSDGNVAITLTPKGENILEGGVNAEVEQISTATKKSKEKLVAVVNTEALLEEFGGDFASLFNKIKQVVFIIED